MEQMRLTVDHDGDEINLWGTMLMPPEVEVEDDYCDNCHILKIGNITCGFCGT